jgi:hypothetical protein
MKLALTLLLCALCLSPICAQPAKSAPKTATKPTTRELLRREIRTLTTTQKEFYVFILQSLDAADTEFAVNRSAVIFFDNILETQNDWDKSKKKRPEGTLNDAFELLLLNYFDAGFLMRLGKMREDRGSLNLSKDQRIVLGEIHARYKLLLGLGELDDIISADIVARIWASAIELKVGMRSYFE